MHKAEVDAFNALVFAIQGHSVKMAEDRRKAHETERQGYMALLFTEWSNVTQNPPSPMGVDKNFLKFLNQIHVHVWIDLIYSMCNDAGKVAVSRSDLQNLLDVTAPNKDALFGSHEILEQQLTHHEHFNAALGEAREKGTHW